MEKRRSRPDAFVESLHPDNEGYRFLIENSSDILWTIDLEGRWQFMTNNVFNVIHIRASDIVGKTVWDFLAPECHDMVRDRLKRRVRGEDIPAYEVLVIDRDGHRVPFEILTTPIHDKTGRVIGVQGISRNITRRKQMEEELRRSRDELESRVAERTRELQQSNQKLENEIVERRRAEEGRRKLIHDLDERVKEQKALYSVAGIFQQPRAVSELLQQVVSILPPAWQYPDATSARITYGDREYRSALFRESPWRQSADFSTSDGKRGSIEVFYTEEMPLEAEGPFLAEERSLINSIADMLHTYLDRKLAEEALRQSEEHLRLASLAAGIGVWSWVPGTSDVVVSDSWRRMFGVSPDMRVIYETWRDSLHPEDRERAVTELNRAVEEHCEYKVEYRIVRPDGSVRWVVDRGLARYDENGRAISMAGVESDITELKQAEEALAEAKARAELYLDLMGHDINNMNQSAQGFLELALQTLEMDGKIGMDGRVLIEKPLQAVQGSSRLISNVRKLQRLAEEGVKIRPVDLHDLFEELRSLDFHVGDRDNTVNIHGVPHWLVGGSDLLQDVFFNLISNAIKHSRPDRPVTIDVGAERVDLNGRAYYRCTVEDDGPGVPDGMKPKLFHRFQRGKTHAHGKGLGLYLVRTLVEGYGGKVWVEDRVKGDHTKGARFVVMLPAMES